MLSLNKPSPFHGILLAIVVFLCLTITFWTGFTANDDAQYLFSSQFFLRGVGIWLPENHWGFRYTVTIPLGILISLFGVSEVVISIVALTYGVALLAAVTSVTWYFFSPRAAFFATLLTATSALFVVQSSILNVDIPEALFCLLSLTFFLAAANAQGNRKWLILSGVMAGLAMLNRETGYGLLIVYGLLFLTGTYMKRQSYLWGLLGIGAVIGFEMLYYTVQGETPLYRFLTAIEAISVGIKDEGKFAAGTGNLSNDRLLGPLTAILFNEEFGILYWATIPAAWFLLKRATLGPLQLRVVQVLALTTLVWFLWIGYSGAVRPLPRYFAASSVFCIILVSIALTHMRSSIMVLVCLTGLITTQIGGLMLENPNRTYITRSLASFIVSNDLVVYTDEATGTHTKRFLMLKSPEHVDKIRYGVAPKDGYMFWNPNMTGDNGKPTTSASIKYRVQAPKRGIGILLTTTGLDAMVPDSIRGRLIYSGQTAIVYQLVE